MNKKLKLQELQRISVEEFKSAEKIPLIVLLDNIRSGNNVGSFFRTCDAFVIEKLVLCGITPQPPHRDIQKTALGATDTVDWDYHEDPVLVVESLKKEGWRIVAVEQAEKTTPLSSWKLSSKEKIVLIFGNEVKGVQQELVSTADEGLEIPQYGTKHSLNVSVCGGIVLWEAAHGLSGER